MACPDFEQLLDYCDGRITENEKRRVADHLATGCQRCAEDINWFERLRDLAAGDDRLAPPAWVLKRAIHLFQEQARPRADARPACLIATMIFNSQMRPAIAGARLAETSNQQLLYRADNYSIDAQITFTEPSSADLIGQVLRDGEYGFESVAGLSITVSRDGQAVCETLTNTVGEFSLHDLAPGEYDVTVETAEGMILIQQLPVAPPV